MQFDQLKRRDLIALIGGSGLAAGGERAAPCFLRGRTCHGYRDADESSEDGV
jgi:hypothetical protein